MDCSLDPIGEGDCVGVCSALPLADPRREAWFAADALSPQFLTANPSARDALAPLEFREAFCTYFGIPSALLRDDAAAGRTIPCGTRPGRMCDAYGRELAQATLPGGDQTVLHDECGEAILSLMEEAGIKLKREPRSIFTALIPPEELFDTREPPSIVPDASAMITLLPAHTTRNTRRPPRERPLTRVYLFDIKTVHMGGGIYFTPRARDEQSGAVAERAHRINGGPSGGEYGAHARELDRRFAREYGRVGTPIADRLASFTQVRGLVFGSFAEASPDVHAIIDLCARALARKHWRSSGARSEKEARSVWVACCRRRIGVAVARAYARYRIRRVVYVGVPRAVIDERAPRGLAARAVSSTMHEADTQALWQHQATVRPNAD